MNNQVERPTFDEAVEQTVALLEAAIAKGAELPEQLWVIKTSINSTKLFDRKDKQRALTAINAAGKTRHTMAHVKGAAKPASKHVEPSLQIKTDELHGSVQAKLPGAEGSEEDASKDNPGVPKIDVVESLKALGFPGGAKEGNEAPDNDITAIIQELEQQNAVPTPAQIALNGKAVPEPQQPQPQPSAVEPQPAAPSAAQDTHQAPEQLQSQQSGTTPSQEKVEMNAANIEQHALTAIVARFGYTSVEARSGLYMEFAASKAAEFPAVYKEVLDAKGPEARDQAFANAYASSQPVGEAFNAFVAMKHPALAKEFIHSLTDSVKGTPAEDRSWFSITGSHGGVRTGWMAAGAALLGAGLETAKAGQITIGSGIGAAIGIGGAFLAGEHLVDDHIDGQFGRYVAAGTLGLLLGASGSALGRMAGGAIESRLQGVDINPGEIAINALPANNPVKVTTNDFSNLGLMQL